MTLPEKFTFVQGKVKTIFALDEPDKVLIQYEDKVTAGNGKREDYPEGKGEICCKISELLFQELGDLVLRLTMLVCQPIEQWQ